MIILIILDGWGIAPHWGGNALSLARLPHFNKLWQTMPHTELKASGKEVGLPGHEMGNSEVGHLNLGAGRIVWQDSSRINEAIKDQSFFTNQQFLAAIEHARKNNTNLHLMGLVSDGNIHSQIQHLFALLELCGQQKFSRVFIHGFTDGRDTEPMAGIIYFEKLEQKLKQLKFGQIASVSGRYFAMDRDNHWERTELVYEAMVNGKAPKAKNALSAISSSYSRSQTDEFIVPTIISPNDKPVGLIKQNDALIFFNFRSDRSHQIALMFAEKKPIPNLYFVTIIPYGFETEASKKIISAFKPNLLAKTLPELISEKKYSQLHLAETEKYAHVTYFFNGGREKPFPGEEQLLVPSPAVPTYDQKPEMSAEQVAGTLLSYAGDKKPDFIVVNFANPDMVGHTGNLAAAVKAVEAVDFNLGKLLNSAELKDYHFFITADHGNVEQMLNPVTGEPDTEHTSNPVPFILKMKDNQKINLRNNGRLSDVAPSILKIVGIEKPNEMSGETLW